MLHGFALAILSPLPQPPRQRHGTKVQDREANPRSWIGFTGRRLPKDKRQNARLRSVCTKRSHLNGCTHLNRQGGLLLHDALLAGAQTAVPAQRGLRTPEVSEVRGLQEVRSFSGL